MRSTRLLLVGLLLAGCGGGSSASGAPAEPSLSPGEVLVEVGSAGRVRAEVADTEDERAQGLTGREDVPLGTGMVFLFDGPSTGRFWMYLVPVPLTATFAREGKVVGIVEMPPCRETEPRRCPTYGPDVPYDTVLETAPETVANRVRVGDPLRVLGPAGQ